MTIKTTFTAPTTGTSRVGHVTLVGAGPGDPELLTLKAVKAIAAATVLLVDDLVNPEVLAHASPQARVVQVGKRGGCKSTPQGWIQAAMLQAALAGEQVVRLKGGDPFVFGRGGEELEYLHQAGIEVSVVNGITSGLAAATALHTPWTHRERAHGVILVTGHAQPGSPGPDWEALAHCAHHAQLTLVIYMGMANIGKLQQGLLTHLPSATPVAVVQHATLATQRHTVTTLGQLVERLHAEQLASPSIVIVGQVLAGLNHLAGLKTVPHPA